MGDDNRIFIRNEAFFELLTIIDLSLYLNQNIIKYNQNNLMNCCNDFVCGNKILLNNYDTLYYINSYSGCVISFTMNGFKISKKNLIDYDNNSQNNILSPYLINIYDDFRFLFLDTNKNKLVEFNPANLDEIFFEYDLNLNNIKIEDINKIEGIFNNEKNKCFDIWVKMKNNFEIVKYNLVEKYDKIELKQNITFEDENDKDNIIPNEKRLKMQTFAKKKGQFKTTMSLTSRNVDIKQKFQ